MLLLDAPPAASNQVPSRFSGRICRFGAKTGSRCDSGAAPATVSGERRSTFGHWGMPREDGLFALTREPGDLPPTP